MKTIVLVLLSITIAFNAGAQQRQNQRMGAVYISVNGNKNLQVAIDGNIYTLNNTSTTVSKSNTISDLSPGMHGLSITGTINNNRRQDIITTQFNLRRNYDMYINVTTDGSLELVEKRKTLAGNRHTPMTATNFNTLMKNLRLQSTTEKRNSYLATTFNTPNNYFTSIQIVQLLQMVRSESDRLPLAKLSFRTATDPNNFSPVYGLFYVAANRNELQEYVNNYDEDGDGIIIPPTDTRQAMSEANFNTLFQTIRGQWSVSTQVSSINTAFNTTGNYFTANQATQLIQVVNAESSRLQLAKASYRTIVDPTNFSTVANLLYSQSSRDELAAYINNGQTGGGTNTRIAMSETDYNALYQAVTAQFLPYAKMTYLTNTFNNTAYYFTSAQAFNLIKLVTNESNRLQLSKAVYRNLVDRANYTLFYDLFTLPASKTEFNAYVQAYRD